VDDRGSARAQDGGGRSGRPAELSHVTRPGGAFWAQNIPFCAHQLTDIDPHTAAHIGGYARALSHVGSHAM